jgi:transposase
LACEVSDPDQVRLPLSIAAVYKGISRTDAAAVGGLDGQSLRDWVDHFNEDGPEGLHDRKAPDAAPKLTTAQKADFAVVVEAGPDPQAHGVVRWRRVDLRDVIEDRFGVGYHERSVSRLLHEMGSRT